VTIAFFKVACFVAMFIIALLRAHASRREGQ